MQHKVLYISKTPSMTFNDPLAPYWISHPAIAVIALSRSSTTPQEERELFSPPTCLPPLSVWLCDFPSVKLLRLSTEVDSPDAVLCCFVLCSGGKSRRRTRPYQCSPSVSLLSSLPHTTPPPTPPSHTSGCYLQPLMAPNTPIVVL